MLTVSIREITLSLYKVFITTSLEFRMKFFSILRLLVTMQLSHIHTREGRSMHCSSSLSEPRSVTSDEICGKFHENITLPC